MLRRATRSTALPFLIFWAGCGEELPPETLPDSGVITPPDGGGGNPDGGGGEEGRADVSVTTLDFGTAVLGTSVMRTLTLTNNSATAAHVSVTEITGPQAAL